jgi:hypothetical protein
MGKFRLAYVDAPFGNQVGFRARFGKAQRSGLGRISSRPLEAPQGQSLYNCKATLYVLTRHYPNSSQNQGNAFVASAKLQKKL